MTASKNGSGTWKIFLPYTWLDRLPRSRTFTESAKEKRLVSSLLLLDKQITRYTTKMELSTTSLSSSVWLGSLCKCKWRCSEILAESILPPHETVRESRRRGRSFLQWYAEASWGQHGGCHTCSSHPGHGESNWTWNGQRQLVPCLGFSERAEQALPLIQWRRTLPVYRVIVCLAKETRPL